ncbi:hypothetical protein EON64_05080 [archaeon]|nr:MAG: hypothetical protein EON64_05080 [archaeon]
MVAVMAMPPVSVVANVRGKKYDVSAETVDEFCQQVASLAGIEADAQSVLFRGKVLSRTDKLQELGVSAGDVLNVVKGRRQKQPNFAEASKVATNTDKAADSVTEDSFLDEVPAKMNQKRMQEAAQAQMNEMLDDLDNYFAPEKLEEQRMQLLEKLDEYEKMVPGFRAQAEAIAKDPETWRVAMMKAKEQMLKLKEMRDAGQLNPNSLFPSAASEAPSASDNSVDDIGEEDD